MLTHEQSLCVEAFMRRETMRIFAYAGAGKTSTLRVMAQNAPRGTRGHYLAFNKAIATDARAKFPNTVECRTLHSMAYRAIITMGCSQDRLNQSLRLQHIPWVKIHGLSQRVARSLILDCLRRFYQSKDILPSWRNVYLPEIVKFKIDTELLDGARNISLETANKLCSAAYKAIRECIATHAVFIWEQQCSTKGNLPLGHDGYLKLWALMRPTIPCDYLFVDEAQDLNPVVIGIVENQQHCQVVTVGDVWQQIYEWRGAVNALEQLPGQSYRLSQSFRFGNTIAHAADTVLKTAGETVTLIGNPNIADAIEPRESATEAILCRTNSGVIAIALDMIQSIPVYIQGGKNELVALINDAERLMSGEEAITQDLLGFKDWTEVKEYCKEDSAESSIKTFVNLVERYGINDLLRLLTRVLDAPKENAITISTAHKSKGLEWQSVELSRDFECENVNLPERRLFYVALTRGKELVTVDQETLEMYQTKFMSE